MHLNSLIQEIHPLTARDYIRERRSEWGKIIASIVIVSIFFNSQLGEYAKYYLDFGKVQAKAYLRPEMFAERSALANIYPVFEMSLENQELLSEFFIRFDRMQQLDKINEVFQKAEVLAQFPEFMTLVQFLAICSNFKVGEKEIQRLFEVGKNEIEFDKKIEQEYQSRNREAYQKMVEERNKEALLADKEVKQLDLEVLEKEMKRYKEKMRKKKTLRNARIVQELQNYIRLAKS